MKYSEVRKEAEKLGFDVDEDEKEFIISIDKYEEDTGEYYEIGVPKKFSGSYFSQANTDEEDDIYITELMLQLAKTPLEEREDTKIYRFELEAFTEIDIKAKSLEEATREAYDYWGSKFDDMIGGIEFIKEVDDHDDD